VKEKQMQKYELMTVKQTAAYLGIAEKTLYTKASQRHIRCYKVGRLLKFDRNEVNQWLKDQAVMPMLERRP